MSSDDQVHLGLHIEHDVAAAIDAWRDWLTREKHASTRTINAYQHDLHVFLNYLGQQRGAVGMRQLKGLVSNDISRYCDSRAAKGQAAASVARILATLRNFFRFLVIHHYIPASPVDSLNAPHVPKKTGEALSRQQVLDSLQTLMDLNDAPWLAKRDLALFGLLYGAGLRLGEALHLNRGEITSEKRLIISAASGKKRTVDLSPWITAAIAAYLKACPQQLNDQQPLFVGVRGKRLNPGVVQRQMRRLRSLLGLSSEVTPHTLRQSFALHRHARGDDVATIQRLLGHAYPSSTQRYLKPSVSDQS